MASSSLIFSKAALAAFGDSGLENQAGSLDAMFGIGLIFPLRRSDGRIFHQSIGPP